MTHTVFPSPSQLDTLAEALAGPGFLVLDGVLPQDLVRALQQSCRDTLQKHGKPAGIGRKHLQQVMPAIRSDETCWLDRDIAAASDYLDAMEALRAGLNARLFLGLFDHECHFARYAPGAAYKTHVDAFSGARSRVLSTVLYLNEDWSPADGGELVLYAPDGRQLLQRVLPVCNRLVVFLSENFPHEVRPAVRERYSVAGWFRVMGARSWLRPV